MSFVAGDFWKAAQAFRAAPDYEAKHKARVVLLQLAMTDDALGRRAGAILANEGLRIIHAVSPIGMRAI